MNAYSKRWQALGFLVAGAFLSPLDYFIVNMALPAIQKAFNATDQQLQLVVAIYGLTYAALVVCGGRLGDLYGRKKIFSLGLYIFLFSSIACAFSPDISMLIAARLFQGIGASLLAPQVLASVRVLFSSTEQPKAVSIFSSVFGLASVAGQLLGGLLLNLDWAGFSWEMVFLVNVPVTIVCITGIHFTMDNNKDLKLSGIDYKGALLLILALLLFICSLIFGREYHWAWWIFVIMITGLVLAIVFFRYEVKLYRQNRPVLIDPTLLLDKRFSLSLPVIFFYNFTAGLFICYPYYLQQYLHYSPMNTGLAIVPYGLAFFLGPLISQRVKFPVNTLIYIGLGLLIIGFSTSSILFYLWQKPSPVTNITLFLAGLGHGVIMPVMMRTAIALVSKDRAGQASALVSISMQVGGVTGGAIIGTVFFSTIDVLSFPKAFALAILMIALFQITGVYINTRLTKYIINNND
ncbi:MFS transporter [Elizabethkingia miricola]|uniref:MFS transporter n=1 Tax=Elizabethkingia miricola TaxID=172045 RepID=A0ABD5B3R9_ELIMR|nr:MFS transporter [Elizabethkingia miricola]MDQ8748305.1 MFS transporter [Elizabethkingia miricola]NHQ68355.1 MFS transporter [Elizabethkingia miricola]NHQ69760.1 MFS transporter [Elizabethkingia miricola]NHQ79169.1 MFS transporter [Elizabethkingia miricola]OPB88033.1 MFS transporter [Elizabethkingia miricola]